MTVGRKKKLRLLQFFFEERNVVYIAWKVFNVLIRIHTAIGGILPHLRRQIAMGK